MPSRSWSARRSSRPGASAACRRPRTRRSDASCDDRRRHGHSLCNGSRPASAPRKDSPDTARLCRTAPGSSAGRSVDRPATCDALSVAREHLSAASRELKPEGYREAVQKILTLERLYRKDTKKVRKEKKSIEELESLERAQQYEIT